MASPVSSEIFLFKIPFNVYKYLRTRSLEAREFFAFVKSVKTRSEPMDGRTANKMPWSLLF
ncbi:hypothetical protein B1H38_04075 [Leptospira borgpetersenii serovar Ballum]|uniref:Uncharacterized protein n=1 Tax=Leptospira borgpetersenii str. Brem 328 TaxID=1049780 RepID=A0ABC9SNQ0_LEPBO|nr:hypothetical protein LEP1GSC056_1270 [Leptospira borgpetersenii str. Brem 328]KGE23755.1 hypothetical protein IQ66_10920 [Leptospira borgpetersenii serovar Ballum]OOV45723.1 hypothetical protein B1H38_04075 [Leptospira borgpetersenii serovar Ballum]